MADETEMCRIDAFDRYLMPGDAVAYQDTQGETSSLKRGEVTGFTAKRIRISIPNAPWKISRGDPVIVEILKAPNQIALIR